MNWFAIRRSQSSSLRHKAWALGRIPNRPPHRRELVPNLIRKNKVLSRPSLLAFLHQLQSPLVALSTLLRLGKGAETNELQHLRQSHRRLPPVHLPPIRFPHKLKNLSKRLRRIEVISQSPSKRLESGPGGGAAGPSPLFARRPLP